MFESLKNHRIWYILSVIALIFYILYSAKMAFFSGRDLWEDETHFWTMVQYCSIGEVFKLMKVEGHMMLWYLVVMPFAKLNFPYPYTMVFLNWLFCTSAIFIMWKKAPFHHIVKILIMLCPVFLTLYSAHARCYSIGICLLFCACAFYKERLAKPYLYFLILWLCANTSFPAAIGATSLGIPFLYELFENKMYKNACIVILLTGLTGAIFYFQFANFQIADFETYGYANNVLENFFKYSEFGSINLTLVRNLEIKLFIILLTAILALNPKVFGIYLTCFVPFVLFFVNVYNPRPWHLAFFVVYLIILSWIFVLGKNKNSNILLILISLFFVSLLPLRINPPKGNKFLEQTFAEIPELSSAKIFTDIAPISMAVMLPDLNKDGIFVYDMNGRNLSNFDAMITYFDKNAKEYEPNMLYKYLDKENFLITLSPIDFKKFKNVNVIFYKEYTKVDRKIYVYSLVPKV